jgi:hypothetical protein
VAKKQLKPKLSPTKGVASFYRFSDWRALWEEFYLSLDEHGGYKYKTVKAFARAKAINNEQRLFLEWWLGPSRDSSLDVKDDPLRKKYFVTGSGPQDWAERRETKGWYTTKNLKSATESITKRVNAIEKLSAAGDYTHINAVCRIEHLMSEVDKAFKGQVFVDGLPFEINQKRANTYFALQDRLLNMMKKAQEIYARSHGINFDDMQGFSHIIAASLSISASSQGNQKSGVETMLESLMKMTLAKSQKHQLALPEDMTKKIIDVQVEKENKKKVQ